MWRDEWLAIRLAVDTDSLMTLLKRLKMEGHPPLWYLIVRATYAATHSYWIVQLVHLLISWGAFVLLLHFVKGKTTDKLLILFGYFFVFEYTVIARNYNLVILFLTLTLIEYQKLRPKWWLVALYTFGMSSSHAYGVLLAIALAFYQFYPRLGDFASWFKKPKVWIGILFLIVLFVLGLKIFVPPSSHYVFNHDKFHLLSIIKYAPKCLSSIWNAFVPIP
jgi:hypothetical protein